MLLKRCGDRYVNIGKVAVRIEDRRIIIEQLGLPGLTGFFDSVKVDVKSDPSDWKKVKGLLGIY